MTFNQISINKDLNGTNFDILIKNRLILIEIHFLNDKIVDFNQILTSFFNQNQILTKDFKSDRVCCSQLDYELESDVAIRLESFNRLSLISNASKFEFLIRFARLPENAYLHLSTIFC